MLKPLRKITDICRLCLSEELDILIPINDAFDPSLTAEDVERFTGVQVPTDDNVPYVICTDCRNRLRKTVAYRNMCIRNNRLYNQLFSEFILETKYQTNEVKECLEWGWNYECVNGNQTAEIFNPKDSILNKSTDGQEEFACEFDEATPSKKLPSQKKRNSARRRTGGRGKRKPPQLSKQELESSYLLDWPYHGKRLCEICGQLVGNYNRHMTTHSKRRMHACPYCAVQMSIQSNLLRHINYVHLKKEIKRCEACGIGFRDYNSYHGHMMTKHGKGKLLECEYCHKKYLGRIKLRKHIKRVHQFQRKHECKLCSKAFKTRRALQDHGRVHSDERPYACKLCTKRFKSAFARRTHELKHSGVVFCCQPCGKSYPYKCQLSIHMKKFHPKSVTDQAVESGVTDNDRDVQIQK